MKLLEYSRSREITCLRVMSPQASATECRSAQRALDRIARDEVHGSFNTDVVQDADPGKVVALQATQSDLVILGMQRLGRRRKTLGQLPARILNDTECAVVLISRRG